MLSTPWLNVRKYVLRRRAVMKALTRLTMFFSALKIICASEVKCRGNKCNKKKPYVYDEETNDAVWSCYAVC